MFLDLELEARLHILTWGGGGEHREGKRSDGGAWILSAGGRGPPADICSLHSLLEVIMSMTTNSMASNGMTCAPMVLDTGNLKSLCQ